MGCLGNLLWFLCGGLISGLSWCLAGCLWCITIIGIPVGMQCFKFASLSFFPFGKEVVYGGGAGSLLLNVIWIIVSGLPLAIEHLAFGAVLCITVIGIPNRYIFFGFHLDLDAASIVIIDSRTRSAVSGAEVSAGRHGIRTDQEGRKMYSIRELADMAGVSTRTLRYYDQIGLLKPAFISDAGYRFYGKQEVDMLQQILFYRERGFDLKSIRRILMEEDFDLMGALEEHLRELKTQRAHMDALISLVHRSIMAMKGEERMDDTEKFQVFKKGIVRQHEEMYGAEARAKYGDGEVGEAQGKILNMTEEEYERFQNLGEEIRTRLEEAVRNGISPESKEAGRIVLLHKEWLGMTWKKYTEEAHKAVAEMYISDERFQAYYDREVPGCAGFLEKAIKYKIGE